MKSGALSPTFSSVIRSPIYFCARATYSFPRKYRSSGSNQIKVSGWAAEYIEKTAKEKFGQTPEKYISDRVSDHVWELMRKEPEEEED